MKTQKNKDHDVTENPLYHNTWKLLKKYRDVIWSLELSVQQVRVHFESEYGSSIEEFLDSIYQAGIDLTGTKLEHHAQCSPKSLQRWFGKNGITLGQFANGGDYSPVRPIEYTYPVKSISNSSTMPRDLETEQDIHIAVEVHAESVAARLRMEHLKCRGVQVGIRFFDLAGFERQRKLDFPCCTAKSIGAMAKELILSNWMNRPLRGLCVRAINLVPDELEQMCLFPSYRREIKQETLEKTCDILERRFGHDIVRPCSHLADLVLSGINPKDDHLVHPVSFFR